MAKTISIAIDGPAGAGKSSAAKALAKKMSFIYMDTGALYRAVGLYCLRQGVALLKDEESVAPHLKDIVIEIKFIEGNQHVFLNGEDVSSLIRTQEVSMAASDVSSIPKVRAFLLDLQRNIASTTNLIMDGRDIGTVILPDADVKIFLTASAQARAQRRTLELKNKGEKVEYEQVLKEIIERDTNDSNREIAPLKVAEDAYVLDNSELNESQTVEKMEEIIKEKIG